VLDDLQAKPVEKAPVEDDGIKVRAEAGHVAVRIVRPPGARAPLPVVVFRAVG
jgi:hypothetical protein